MDGTGEYRAQKNPGEAGAPAVLGRQDGTDQRAGAGDGGEVVAE